MFVLFCFQKCLWEIIWIFDFELLLHYREIKMTWRGKFYPAKWKEEILRSTTNENTKWCYLEPGITSWFWNLRKTILLGTFNPFIVCWEVSVQSLKYVTVPSGPSVRQRKHLHFASDHFCNTWLEEQNCFWLLNQSNPQPPSPHEKAFHKT